MNTRVGQLELRIPQTRGYRDENGRPFYPKALDRGVRSERGDDPCHGRNVGAGRQHQEGDGRRRGALRS